LGPTPSSARAPLVALSCWFRIIRVKEKTLITLNGVDALTNARTQLESTARKIAQGPPSPDDMVSLIEARQQFSAGTKVIHTEDQMTGTLLDLFG
jgi:hypothetical protein